MLTNFFAINMDQSIWGPDASEFKPNRFLQARKDQLSRGASSFGFGARSCPGEKMAQSDMFYAIVRTLQKVKLTCPDGPGTANLQSIESDMLIDVRRPDLIFSKLN